MSKKILIIGGGGYVGTMLVPALLSKNHTVTVFDLFTLVDIAVKFISNRIYFFR